MELKKKTTDKTPQKSPKVIWNTTTIVNYENKLGNIFI